MRKTFAIALAMMLSISLFVGCGNQDAPGETIVVSNGKEEEEMTANKGRLMMATTTSMADTGLLEALAPLFHEDAGWELLYTAVGSGEALQLGRNGDVDIMLLHDKASEVAFVADGYGVERFPVMYNDFVVIGPEGQLESGNAVGPMFQAIYDQQLPFVSRGDNSGTNQKEKEIWTSLEINPAGNANYIESGQGMGATISMADEKQAFCLTDRGTWLKQKIGGDLALELEIVCEGDPLLINQYGVIAVSPEKYPDANMEGAQAFIDWIRSERIQEFIGQFGVEQYGEPLFYPTAN